MLCGGSIIHLFGCLRVRMFKKRCRSISLPEFAMRLPAKNSVSDACVCSAVTKRDCDPLYLMRAYLNTRLCVSRAHGSQVFLLYLVWLLAIVAGLCGAKRCA